MKNHDDEYDDDWTIQHEQQQMKSIEWANKALISKALDEGILNDKPSLWEDASSILYGELFRIQKRIERRKKRQAKHGVQ